MSAPPPPPPPPASKPGRVLVYNVSTGYTPVKDGELAVEEGDLIFVSEGAPDGEHWDAHCGNSKGRLPRAFRESVCSDAVGPIEYPLHEAAKRGNIALLQECLENRVSVNSLDKSASTALYWAAHGGHEGIAKYLLTVPNVSISSQNKLGDTPLHAAAWKGRAECVQLLIEAGADVLLRNKERKRPIDLASTPETAALLSITMSSGLQADDADYEGASSDGDEQKDP